MVDFISGKLSEAANAKDSLFYQIRHAVDTVIALENLSVPPSEEDEEKMDTAIDTLLSGLRSDQKVAFRIVDVAGIVKDLINNSKNSLLKNHVLSALETRIDSAPTLNERVVDHLAMAALYQRQDSDKAFDLNETALWNLAEGQNNNVPVILKTIAAIQAYYPRHDSPVNGFTLLPLQVEDIDDVLTDIVEIFLESDVKDPAIADQLAPLVLNIDDWSIGDDLDEQLFDHLSPAQKIAYIETALANTDEMKPALTRFGETHDDIRDAIERAGGSIAHLLGFEIPADPRQQTLDLTSQA